MKDSKPPQEPFSKKIRFFIVGSIAIFISMVIILTAFMLLNPQKISDFVEKYDDSDGEIIDRNYSLPLTGNLREVEKVAVPVSDENDSLETIQAESPEIYGLTIDADIEFTKPDSMVRAVLATEDDKEYLIYESYPLLAGGGVFSIVDTCEETCVLNGVKPKEIRIETENNASIYITNIVKVFDQSSSQNQQSSDEIKEALLDLKVQKLNEEIKSNNLKWFAGKNDFARLAYSEKKKMYNGKLPNFQGFEFYDGGVFEVLEEVPARDKIVTISDYANAFSIFFENAVSAPIAFISKGGFDSFAAESDTGDVKAATSVDYVDSWDWRKVHGANDKKSFYYDGDDDVGEKGNGWMTSVKNQGGCGSCWAFAATGATESLVNLYFNKHIDLDLSEQDAVSCSGAGGCSGGWPGVTLDYYTTTGVVDEACFPYTASDESCSNKCTDPNERIKISGKVPFNENRTEENLKYLIINNGPLSGGIYSWSHAMTLLGWQTDSYGEAIWIFKNSWSSSWGEDGYGYIKTPISNIGWTHALVNPVIDTGKRSVRCIDADGDGYYNWGIGLNKPATCPSDIPDEKDCNDSNAAVSIYDQSYNCIGMPSDVYFNTSLYNFKYIPVGQLSQPKEIVVGNQGENDLFVTDIHLLTDKNFVLDFDPLGAEKPCQVNNPVIAPNDYCSIWVSFNPSKEGNLVNYIVVESSDSKDSISNITVSGIGTYDPKTVCLYFGGEWVGLTNKCYRITSDTCDQYFGIFNTCDSYCTEGLGCTQQCVESCEF